METKTTIKKLFGITYLIQVQKIYYSDTIKTEDNVAVLTERKVISVTRETYFFDIKIHSTQIIF